MEIRDIAIVQAETISEFIDKLKFTIRYKQAEGYDLDIKFSKDNVYNAYIICRAKYEVDK